MGKIRKVWQHFDKVSKLTAKYKACGKICPTSGNTSNLMYPNLYEIARQKMSIVATSVPSERLFSKTGNIISKKRNRLTEKRLSKLVFMSSLSEEDWFQTD